MRSFLEKKNEGSDGKQAKMKQKYPTTTTVKEVYVLMAANRILILMPKEIVS
jgi:hypothetical protein